jgi:hypothetical protein
MASRKEEKERRRQERLERERAERARAARTRRLYGILVGTALVGAAIVAVVAVAMSGGGDSASGNGNLPKVSFANPLPPPEQKETDLPAAAKAAGCVLKNPAVQGRTHLGPKQPTPKYSTDPPTSGNHDPLPTLDGFYAVPPKPRHFVHTLEHGRIEFQYSPTLARRQVRELGGLYNEDKFLVLLFPNETMSYKVAATAWGHLMGCNKVDDATFDALRAFRDRYRDQAPEPSSSQPANT